MTDLTEQNLNKKNGKTFFYIKLPNGEIIQGDEFALGLYRMCRDGDKVEMLEQVPSYDEWQRLNWYAGNGVEENQELKMKNAKLENSIKDLKHRNENLRLALKTYELPEIQKILTDWRTGELDKKFNKFEKENAKLKELLKDCRDVLQQHILSAEEYKLYLKMVVTIERKENEKVKR